jgi:hypothetical protein
LRWPALGGVQGCNRDRLAAAPRLYQVFRLLDRVMRITITRPYFAPHPGFFYRAHLADALVLLDRVQFPRRTTWITRNRFKNDQGTLWLTIPVHKKHLGLQPIDAVRINSAGRWARKYPAALRQAYTHAPYLDDYFGFVEETLSAGYPRILDLNLVVCRYLLDALGIRTPILLQSTLAVEDSGDALLLAVCRAAGADEVLVPRDVGKHIDSRLFARSGIALKLFTMPQWTYPQLWGDFIANLSVFDLLFNCGAKARDILLGSVDRKTS